MSLRDELSLITPRLRRYAKALSNSACLEGETSDGLVQRTLMHALQTGALSPRSDIDVWLYSLLTQFHRDAQNRLHGASAAGDGRSSVYGSGAGDKPMPQNRPLEGLGAGLANLNLDQREALLLVVLEGFSYGQASHILRISRATLIARLAHARATLSTALTAMPRAASSQRRPPPYLRLIK